VDTLLESRPGDSAFVVPGTYRGTICRPEPGERLFLRVETPAGEVVTSATTVPGASGRTVTAGSLVPNGGAWVLDREQDTLAISVTPNYGKALQVEVRNAARPDDLAFFFFTDTMALRFPGNLVNPFEGDDGESIFRAGRLYMLAVALTDSNYYDFLRSRSDPLTGRGFINHLTGGIGVFGSVETRIDWLRVVAPVDDPREGVYRITGMLDTTNVDATLELYVDEVQPELFSAFVEGTWREGPIDASADGVFADRGPEDMFFQFGVAQDSLGVFTGVLNYAFEGVRPAAGTSFPVTVRWFDAAARATVVDTLTAQQISGPSGGGRQ
jgi:hypothetical protein